MALESINSNWSFTKDIVSLDNLQNAKWQQVDIPHTWNARDGQDGGNDYDRGLYWYKKELSIREEHKGKRLFVEFEGANSIANAYLNGVHLGEHKGGYATFRLDITGHIQFDSPNTLLVSVDNTHHEDVYPLMADFTFFGGIYRNVNLIAAEDVHFDLMDHGSQGIYVSQTKVTNEKASIEIRVNAVNERGDGVEAECKVELMDAEGSTVKAAAERKMVCAKEAYIFNFDIQNPVLWNGVDNPYLYTVKATLNVDGVDMDAKEIPTGLRYFHADPQKGFFLNGRPVRLNGVSRHQDRKDKGWAVSESDQTEDMALIKEMGANAIRLAHYQHSQYFYDLCDREGMIVWAEIPYISISSKTDMEGTNAYAQMVDLIRQNYNHASICFWGIQNEVTISGKRNNVENIVTELNKLTKKEDPYRLTTQAQVGHLKDDDSLNQLTDVVAYNKYFGWYYDDVEEFDAWLNSFKKTNPFLALGISEYGCDGVPAYHTDQPVRSDYTEEYQALYHEKALWIFEKHQNVWGIYVWNMFDFASDMRDEGGVQGMNSKGLVTHDRKIKKDAYFLYKANWSDDKFVHIASKRYQERAADKIDVKVYSNLPKIILYANGKEVGASKGSHHVFVFEGVALTDGRNEMKAVCDAYSDNAVFIKVKAVNESYRCKQKKKDAMDVEKWFDKIQLDTEIKELEFTPGCFSIKDSIGDIIANDEGDKIMRKYMPDMFEHSMFEMVKGFSIEMLANMHVGILPEVVVYNINKELNKVHK